jgi:hypothetical protein
LITSDGWVTWATRVEGIKDKIYSQPNSGQGFACHSIVGSINAALGRFLSTERLPDGRYTPYAAASCVFLLAYDGKLIQMYPITASTWTSGGPEGNCNYIPLELEGGWNPYDEPMTDAQVETFVRLIRELEQHKGFRYLPGRNMLEHWQVAEKYSYAPTACASGRYARGWAALQGDKMSELDKARLDRLESIVAGFGINDEAGNRLTGNDALEYAFTMGLSAFLGIQGQNAALTAHKAVPHTGGYTEEEIEAIAINAVADKLGEP